MSAREAVLDAYETLLIERDDQAATIEAIAKAAGKSKGGLLYHFPSKQALADGLIERLQRRTGDDIANMRAADEGAVHYYLRTSAVTDDYFGRTLMAVTKIGARQSSAVEHALSMVQERFLAELKLHCPTENAAIAVLLLGEGLYYNEINSGFCSTAKRDVTDEVLAAASTLIDATSPDSPTS
ncbi:Nucleoid occlusion factor SlmA [Corynebacterium ciconiae DSM 44920]|uniref:TetR/AcrR family transcriptional regulator n=1 Tax=Corynebacterium ciconiae TaxID=227319 RepID=UPI0003689522|nr:TetR/AcrR family transcriptional regulator [Corynebacterium ciconiae]WKD60726.1 Nucleoid occlusion factor SlmA [Corynebacterium ciconiae DSM 44920]